MAWVCICSGLCALGCCAHSALATAPHEAPVAYCVACTLLSVASSGGPVPAAVVAPCLPPAVDAFPFSKAGFLEPASPPASTSASEPAALAVRKCAVKCLKAAVAADREMLTYRRALARELRKLGQSAESVPHLQHVLAAAAGKSTTPPPPWLWNVAYQLGKSLRRVGDRAGAVAAFEQVLRLQPGHAASTHWLTVLRAGMGADAGAGAGAGGGACGAAGPVPVDYVKGLYQGYASKFNDHLVKKLHYRTPELVCDLLKRCGGGGVPRWASVLDLGCGTGLCGVALAPFLEASATVVGVDVSKEMLAEAKALQPPLYAALHEADLLQWLAEVPQPDPLYDVVVAADVFVYIGPLEAVFAGVKRLARPGALFCFSTEADEEAEAAAAAGAGAGAAASAGVRSAAVPPRVRATGRFAHCKAYVLDVGRRAAFTLRRHERSELRWNKGKPVVGDVYVWEAPRK